MSPRFKIDMGADVTVIPKSLLSKIAVAGSNPCKEGTSRAKSEQIAVAGVF